MPTDPTAAIVALNRFGLGARPGDPAAIAGDARGFVVTQINRRDAARLERDGLQPSDAAFRAIRLAGLQKERERRKAVSMPAPSPAMVPGAAPVAAPAGTGMPANPEPPLEAKLFRAEAAARFERQARTENGLVERLVLFWSNHFAVSIEKAAAVRVMAGPFEREAIRPHVLGRFADMLKAVETHPAMLIYLDANQSIGPNSFSGITGKRGLNENLAREILELHTLGVDGGYSQADVTHFARAITGWTVNSPEDDLLYGGRFTFAFARHEPGEQAVLAKVYAEGGVEQGRAILDDLARHPATARHLARKLAAHFVADEPAPTLVDRLERTFSDTDGDLEAVTRALVEAPESWQMPLQKLRTPQNLLVATIRATGKLPEIGALLATLNALGQPLWQPPGPNGWSDASTAWSSPDGMSARLDFAAHWGRQNARLDPNELLEAVLGPAASAQTRQAVSRAESRQQGLALLFMSPEFQRC